MRCGGMPLNRIVRHPVEPSTILLNSVRILRTGADGGHLYLKGRGAIAPHGEVDVYAYFKDKDAERKFESSFTGQCVKVTSADWTFTPTIGVGIRDVEWVFQDA